MNVIVSVPRRHYSRPKNGKKLRKNQRPRSLAFCIRTDLRTYLKLRKNLFIMFKTIRMTANGQPSSMAFFQPVSCPKIADVVIWSAFFFLVFKNMP